MFKVNHAMAAVSAGLVLAIAGCSMQPADTGMTDGEIMAAIEAGDAETLEKSKAATDEAIEAAFAGVDEFTDEERDALRASIMAEVDKRLSGLGGTTVNRCVTEEHPTYVTENTYVTQGGEKPPRIEDGMEVAVDWGVEKVYVDDDGCVFTVESVEARAYNFAPDTPYAGGGYAYRLEVKVKGSFKPVEHDDPNIGYAQHSGWSLPVDMMLDPHDIRMNGEGSAECDYDDHTFENTYSMPVNMLPERIYAVSSQK